MTETKFTVTYKYEDGSLVLEVFSEERQEGHSSFAEDVNRNMEWSAHQMAITIEGLIHKQWKKDTDPPHTVTERRE